VGLFRDGLDAAALRGALFPYGAGVEENRVPPQRLVVEGPYRYVRNPLYVTGFALILRATLLASNLLLILLGTLYAVRLVLQLAFRERELRRFGLRYSRYCRLVPRSSPGSAQCGSRTWPESRQASGFDNG
jgi:protein-S-isoprenylcysteine O-methyltransferase Ste14